jgi:hypothetical protein
MTSTLHRRPFSLWCMALCALLITPFLHAAEMTEQAKIEAMISSIEAMNDAKFVRNGSEYTSKNAAKFLRGKWDANKDEVITARDFIEKIATKSSTTGKPYLIRPKGGAETPCADFLRARLKTIESTAK